MQTRNVKIPGPDHPISIEPNKARVIVKSGGRVVADTRQALVLREAAYPAVLYKWWFDDRPGEGAADDAP